ncbi:hypothetical protein K470DRAFT_255376 [Piedraia hortae CBS 480.64]|uniref:Uncharacterized protein n=1 Tax=Piedraia hortae CBS 480.64 TaxID=1314780 RepID=A0A6A7C6S1_9PEZI|nr:hypothetical protein K470DRAFT_255376 [Piedraia hortae CBS 480.64]
MNALSQRGYCTCSGIFAPESIIIPRAPITNTARNIPHICWIQASPLARMRGICIAIQRYLLHYQLHYFPSGSCHI